MHKPLLVTLFGGPGTGKSTTAALVFGELKQRGVNAELVTEYAKELVYEEHAHKLAYQPYVAVKQLWRLERLRETDVIVTDTSPLLGAIYGEMNTHFLDFLIADHLSRNTLDIFLERDPTRIYNPIGREQTEEEAVEADEAILSLLDTLSLYPTHLTVDKENNRHVDFVLQMVDSILHELTHFEQSLRHATTDRRAAAQR